ncbi:NUDIX hydrolase [Marinimicrobium agarilyticum]|uniref:NUDIX hydrolase n=1 Tax=Marinimicrobium agarilyticum TaxID=306546 RepID=UPI00041E62EC|nr:NUDIX hydrolase [Marinimicrobium agarilyticum]
MTWAPHVTVATVVEHDGRFLFVYEESDGRQVYNQPAGHLEPGETLIEAAVRETLEETRWQVRPTALLGIGLYTAPANGVTYLRHTFAAEALEEQTNRALDEGIIEPCWLSREELLAREDQWRSPMVLEAVDEYLSGQRYPLELFRPHQ